MQNLGFELDFFTITTQELHGFYNTLHQHSVNLLVYYLLYLGVTRTVSLLNRFRSGFDLDLVFIHLC